MKLFIDDKILALLPEDKEEEIFVKSFFTYKDTSGAFRNGRYNEKFVKTICFAKKKKDWYILNSGFLKELVEELKSKKIKVTEVEDKRTKFDYMKKEFEDEELNKYFPFNYNEHQKNILKVMLKTNRGIIIAPTSAGKSFSFFAFIKLTKIPTLLLVNRITLANQIYEGAIEYGIKNVGIWSSNKRIKGNGLMIATIGSVLALPSFTEFQCLIIDEVHNASAKTFQEFLSKVNYPVQFGFSATPNKGDKYKYALIRRFIGMPIITIKSDELIENKVMAKPIIHFVNNEISNYENWPDTMIDGIINNTDRNRKIVKIITKYNLPSLILIDDVKYKQGEKIARTIEEESDKKVIFLSGDASSDDRDNAIKQIENNEIDVIIGTSIFNEGVSIKNIHLFINAAFGKSIVRTLQRVGRSLRKMEGKEKAMIFDFTDSGNKYTEKHSKIRKNHYIKAGYTDISIIDI